MSLDAYINFFFISLNQKKNRKRLRYRCCMIRPKITKHGPGMGPSPAFGVAPNSDGCRQANGMTRREGEDVIQDSTVC